STITPARRFRTSAGPRCGRPRCRAAARLRRRRCACSRRSRSRRSSSRKEPLMAFQEIEYAVRDRVATITLNRPEAMNAFTTVMIAEWAEAVREASADEDVRVLIVTGEGRGFCAGQDMKMRAATNAEQGDRSPIIRRND